MPDISAWYCPSPTPIAIHCAGKLRATVTLAARSSPVSAAASPPNSGTSSGVDGQIAIDKFTALAGLQRRGPRDIHLGHRGLLG
ncbi:Uncharacterised protein [Mycobacteroides abscessus subsp. abscessus]|nr:Uncharacterised protein [Mycobacteroides abscessus subsp. abscessus]